LFANHILECRRAKRRDLLFKQVTEKSWPHLAAHITEQVDEVARPANRWRKQVVTECPAQVEATLEETEVQRADSGQLVEEESREEVRILKDQVWKCQEALRIAKEREAHARRTLRRAREQREGVLQQGGSDSPLGRTTTVFEGVKAGIRLSRFGLANAQYSSEGAEQGFTAFGRPRSTIGPGFSTRRELFGFPTKDDVALFELGEKLGDGMDGTWKCADVVTGETWVCKKYPLGEFVDHSYEILSDLHAKQVVGAHPNIVRYQHVIETDSTIYVLMEFIPGETLSNIIACKHRLPEAEAVEIFIQLCEALRHCHNHNVVHADVKPENIMVIDGYNPPQVKLIDFGIASFLSVEPHGYAEGYQRNADDDLSPPEVMEGQRKASREVDLWRLGCTLFSMLVGHAPFRRNADGLVSRCRDRELRAKRELDFGMDPHWSQLSMAARDIIMALLRDRCSAEMALQHPWTTHTVK